jgi:hypothetical protein
MCMQAYANSKGHCHAFPRASNIVTCNIHVRKQPIIHALIMRGTITHDRICTLLTYSHLVFGSGKYTWVNGRVYDGGWMDNVMHGAGVESDQGTRYAVEVCMHMRTCKSMTCKSASANMRRSMMPCCSPHTHTHTCRFRYICCKRHA